MIDKILFAVEDNRDRMVPLASHAAEMAGALDADVVLIHVYGREEFEEYLDRMDYDSSDPDDVARRHEVVEACASEFADRGVRPDVVGETGDPAAEITDRVETDGIDHVVLGGRRRAPVTKAVTGSVSGSVLRSVDVPCTIGME
ncbi:universal stress protein [Natronomonas sp.]|uniref:universal stress protein n=1 Tax=Natronomonas sp. TaxID=2184060 RepID=UPI002630B91A|nr:universal stress protein [Natronomonas sp.]